MGRRRPGCGTSQRVAPGPPLASRDPVRGGQGRRLRPRRGARGQGRARGWRRVAGRGPRGRGGLPPRGRHRGTDPAALRAPGGGDGRGRGPPSGPDPVHLRRPRAAQRDGDRWPAGRGPSQGGHGHAPGRGRCRGCSRPGRHGGRRSPAHHGRPVDPPGRGRGRQCHRPRVHRRATRALRGGRGLPLGRRAPTPDDPRGQLGRSHRDPFSTTRHGALRDRRLRGGPDPGPGRPDRSRHRRPDAPAGTVVPDPCDLHARARSG